MTPDRNRPDHAAAPGFDEPDDRDLDDGGLDLTPRTGAAASPRSAPRRRWTAVAVLVGLAGVLVFIVVQARGASLYSRTADEAVAQKVELGDQRFRLQGVVVGKPVEDGTAKVFDVAYRGVSVTIRHTGKEPALFKPGLPVVAEGRWNDAGTQFDSDRLLVKHTEDYKKADVDRKDYEQQHPDRIVDDEDLDDEDLGEAALQGSAVGGPVPAGSRSGVTAS